MGKLQDSMRTALRIRGNSERTIEIYLSCVRIFAKHFRKSPLQITTKEIEAFFQFLREHKKSDSTIHGYYISLKTFYSINNMKERLPHIHFKRIINKIPLILSQEKISIILDSCDSLKYKTLFSLAYASGLRMSEIQNLSVHDIDFERKQLYVRNGKNGKYRYTLLGDKTIRLLNVYMNVYKPHSYLFFNRDDSTRKVNGEAVRREFRKLLAKNNLDTREIHIHTLRHCFATHLMENGTSLFYIMHLLGHSSIRTTMVYLHMQDLNKLNIVSPIDSLKSPQVKINEQQHDLFNATA
jgi:integrase/recombinase XerD